MKEEEEKKVWLCHFFTEYETLALRITEGEIARAILYSDVDTIYLETCRETSSQTRRQESLRSISVNFTSSHLQDCIPG